MSRKRIKTIQSVIQTGFHCSPESYWRAATRRLETAKFLLEFSSYYLDAVYLAGYGVECALKCLILERTPRSKWLAQCEEISSGVKSHDFHFLRGVLGRKAGSMDQEIVDYINDIQVERWTDLRYAGLTLPRGEAEHFLGRVELIYRWVGRNR